ncbi:phosphatase PAP2 family protein [Streptomyces sp. NPDC015144]|uniref:phosphatase PAP2 family protein n=1 Tax=Streptomyces sp. NPDC015144 TaxID=3364944 RepID=UPI00370057AD
MTSTTTAPAPARAETRAARLITDGMEPRNVIVAVSLGVGLAQDNPLTGVLWALEAILFAAVLPMAFIKYGMRKGMWADRHIGQRQRRMILIPVIMTLVGLGIGGMLWFDAPTDMVALVVAMLATLAVLLPVTAFWKISVHTAVAGGALAMLALTWGPLVWLAYPLVAVIAWSRISLRDHTLAQTIAGAAAGTATAGLVFAALTT